MIMEHFAGLRILIGAAVYPATKGEKITALAGISLTAIGIWAVVRLLTLYQPPPSGLDDSWISLVSSITVVLWLLVATAYKGFVVRGFQISPLGLTGLGLCMATGVLGMIAAAYRTPVDYQSLSQIDYYQWVAAGGIVVGNGWVDIFMLIHKILREQGVLS